MFSQRRSLQELGLTITGLISSHSTVNIGFVGQQFIDLCVTGNRSYGDGLKGKVSSIKP